MESLEIIDTKMMESAKESIMECSSKSSQSDQDLSRLTDMLNSTTSESQTDVTDSEVSQVTDSEVSLTPDLEATNSFLNSILENSSNLEEFSHADSTVCSPQQNSVTDLENSQNQEAMEGVTKTDESLLKSSLSKEIPDEVPMEVDTQNLSKSPREEEKPNESEGAIEDQKPKLEDEEEEEKMILELGEKELEKSVLESLPSSSVVDSVSQSTSNEIDENLEASKDNRTEPRQSSEESTETESHIFVQVNERNERDENKTTSPDDTQEQDEDFDNQPQEDPIASDDFENIPMEDENDENDQVGDEEQGASEELCIIPDTERVISQEEKDAASIMPLRTEPTENSESSSKQHSPEASEETEGVNDSLATKYLATLNTDESDYTCMQCSLLRRCKYSIAGNNGGNCRYVCDENCFKTVKELYCDKLDYVGESEVRVKNLGTNSDNMVGQIKYVRKCANCSKEILNDSMNLSWEIMEFCNEACLSKYQKKIGSNCANCSGEVKTNCLGKYSVRFGYDIRQFCSSVCLEEYKKGLKACSYCQKDMSGGGDGFLAPVGDKGQFKDFCTKICMERYDRTSNNKTIVANRSSEKCSVCNQENPVSIEFELNNKMNLFCSDPCFVAFKFVNNIVPGKCDMCRKYFDNKVLEENSIFYDNAQHSFCSNTCQNIYIIAQRKIVPCSWCKVKKYNFDMIKNLQGPTGVLLCSLNCYNLYQVSVNARISCDQCSKNAEPMYHLTMSDSTIRNFCSHSCAVTFQNHFPKSLSSEDPSIPVPVGKPRKSKRTSQNESSSNSDMTTMPVISSVHSLAVTNGPTSNRITRGAKNKMDASMNSYQSMKTQIKQQIIIKSAPMPSQRNMGTMCKVRHLSKSITAKPTMVDKEIQTDEVQDKTAVIPIPVPIYVPTPSCMYSLPFPIPFPFALPIPVPIFIPTTRNSATGIMKEIKKIQVKIPTDPFEAELLMMAEMVAGDKKEENTDSESEEEDTPAPPEEVPYNPEPIEPSNTFGEDMLQMALKMATELEEPAVDLEGALTANTITASQTGETGTTEETVDDPQPMHHLMERQPVTRGRKRPGRPPRHGGSVSKRGRRSSSQMDIPLMAPPQTPQPAEPVEKPDANMCLKYTFGVNAWKQWVTTKNAELEKSTRRVKLFKPEILQLTADELNYSLCLFVKEVRKPNGQEYAPDTIYYLCLGIQQYLFENGRIDNIFCDTYYEKFTDCLDEVARKFSVLYNDSHYIVTRVEEEHLWESKQLGAHSPHVLLSTLMFFNTKHFNLTSVDEHMQLSFSHIMKHWKRNPNQPGGTNKVGGSRNVLLRFYPPQTATQTNVSLDTASRKKKVYEQQENEENPLRCPVKLYEFYLSKCPESVKTRNDVFYLLPERSCVPDSPVWYSTMPLPRNALEKMLHRVKMVKEINVALLTS